MNEYARYDEEEQEWLPETDSPNSGIPSSLTFLIGLGVGATLALLFTPASGREVRSAIAHGCRGTMDGISRGTQELRERGATLLTFNRRQNRPKYHQG